MTKQEIRNGILSIIENFPTYPNEEMTETQNVELTDSIANYLDNVNPNHNYPPTNK